MTIVFELVTVSSMLALGFVLGRIWEIRKELRAKHRRAAHDLIRRWEAGHGLVSAHASSRGGAGFDF